MLVLLQLAPQTWTSDNARDASGAAAELLPVLQLLQQVCRVDNLLQTAVVAWLAACDGFPAFIS
jgi:hypothetical protein